MNERRSKDAITELRQADKLSPGHAPVHIALGVALDDNGQTAAAQSELKSALELDPKSVRARDRLAQILAAERRYTAAIRYLQEAIRLDPKTQTSELLWLSITPRTAMPRKALRLL